MGGVALEAIAKRVDGVRLLEGYRVSESLGHGSQAGWLNNLVSAEFRANFVMPGGGFCAGNDSNFRSHSLFAYTYIKEVERADGKRGIDFEHYPVAREVQRLDFLPLILAGCGRTDDPRLGDVRCADAAASFGFSCGRIAPRCF